METPKKTIRIDAAVLGGAELLAQVMGLGEVWNGGLGHVVGRVVGASDISKRPIDVDAARRRIGFTDQNIETAQAIANIGRQLFKGKRA